MTHFVQGFVAELKALRLETAGLGNAEIILLKEDLGLLLNTDNLYDELVGRFIEEDHLDEMEPRVFWKLHTALEGLAVNISKRSPVVYFETDYWGGDGIQSAVAWHYEKVIYGPMKSNEIISQVSPINSALRSIGVRHDPSQLDEFDTLGLGRYRTNEDWILQPSFGPHTGKGYHPTGTLAKILRWLKPP